MVFQLQRDTHGVIVGEVGAGDAVFLIGEIAANVCVDVLARRALPVGLIEGIGTIGPMPRSAVNSLVSSVPFEKPCVKHGGMGIARPFSKILVHLGILRRAHGFDFGQGGGIQGFMGVQPFNKRSGVPRSGPFAHFVLFGDRALFAA